MRNVGVREHIDDAPKQNANDGATIEPKIDRTYLHRNSLPNILLKDLENIINASNNANTTNNDTMVKNQSIENASQSSIKRKQQQHQPVKMNSLQTSETNYENDDEGCAVSGRLEIRVVQQQQPQPQQSNNQMIQKQIESSPLPDISSTNNDNFDKLKNDRINKTAETTVTPTPTSINKMNSVSDGQQKAVKNLNDQDLQNAQQHPQQKYILSTNNDSLNDADNNQDNTEQNGKSQKNNGTDIELLKNNKQSITNIDNVADNTFLTAPTTFGGKLSNDDIDSNVNDNVLCNENDSISINNDKNEIQIVSCSFLLNQSQLEQKDMSASANNSIVKQISTQSDGTTSTTNQYNKRDTNTCSKIPIFNPNIRSTKCASWAGTEYPITTADLTNLTPGD